MGAWTAVWVGDSRTTGTKKGAQAPFFVIKVLVKSPPLPGVHSVKPSRNLKMVKFRGLSKFHRVKRVRDELQRVEIKALGTLKRILAACQLFTRRIVLLAWFAKIVGP